MELYTPTSRFTDPLPHPRLPATWRILALYVGLEEVVRLAGRLQADGPVAHPLEAGQFVDSETRQRILSWLQTEPTCIRAVRALRACDFVTRMSVSCAAKIRLDSPVLEHPDVKVNFDVPDLSLSHRDLPTLIACLNDDAVKYDDALRLLMADPTRPIDAQTGGGAVS
jgi:hypothetical protein